jgi:hypothetical protein
LGAVLSWTAHPFSAAAATPAETALPGASSSAAARRDAIQSIPRERLDAEARAKVDSVLGNITVFRRFPTRMITCDPDLYLFVVRHPDVVVNIWEALGLSQLQFRQTGPDTYHAAETAGTAATLEFLYHTKDTQVVYGQWSYIGPLLPRAIRGRCLAALRSSYAHHSDGRYAITSRLDGFLTVEPGGAELLTKALHPLVVKNADYNFVQTVGFVGSLSRTAEANSRGLERLALRLTNVQPDIRRQFAEVVAGVAERAAMLAGESHATSAAMLSGRPSGPSAQ